MGGRTSKSRINRDNNTSLNKYSSNQSNNEEIQIEEFQNDFLSDSMQQRHRDIQKQKYEQQTNYPEQPINSMQVNNNYNNNDNNNQVKLFPQIKCQIHQTEDIKGINMNTNIKQKMCCFKCILENKYNAEDLIDIEDIFNIKQNLKFYQQWPKFNNQKNKEVAINSLSNNDPIYGQLKEKFISIKKSIMSYIETYFQEIEMQLKNIQQQKYEIKVQLESLDFQQQIKDILLQNNKQKNDLDQQITDLMNKQIKQQSYFEKQIEEYCQNQEEIKQSFDLIESFKQNFVEQKQQQNQQQQQFKSENNQILSQNQIKSSQDLNDKLTQGQIFELSTPNIINTYGQFSTELINDNKYVHLTSCQYCSAYLNIELKFDQKYEFQIQIKKQQEERGIIIGLANLNLNQENKAYLSDIFLYDGNKYKVWSDKTKSIKNKLISEEQQILNKDITLQIHLKEKIFRWKYNNNINCAKKVDCKSNDPQYLFFTAHNSDIDIIIKSMKKVNVFEKWK